MKENIQNTTRESQVLPDAFEVPPNSVSPSMTNRMKSYLLDGAADDVIARYASLPQLAAELDFGELDTNIVVLDTETTGFSFEHDELIQIAAARLEHGIITDWYVTFVNPSMPIPEDIVHLTGISDEEVKDAPTPSDALKGLADFVGDAKIVAHNVPFDRTFSTHLPSGSAMLENIWIDSLDLSRIALPKLKSHRLIDLVRAFDAPISTHRADADVEATCAVYRILLAAIWTMPNDLVVEISSMATLEQWPTVHVFKTMAVLQNPQGEPTHFSLRALRKRRVSGLAQQKTKVDAEAIASDPLRQLDCPSEKEINSIFSNDGLLSGIYENYESRFEQGEMSRAIGRAFAKGENLVVEAGTGVGKSMAYLAPLALLAKKNNITVGVATKTNALLDQLVYQELPALSHAFRESAASVGLSSAVATPLSFAPLKGIAHYPCLRKIGHVVENGPAMKLVAGKEVSQAPALAGLLSYIEQSEFDDIDTLKIDYRTLPRYAITSTSTECLKRKCTHFGTLCFVHGARRQAENADIVVTNHSLLFSDLAAEGGLLPPIRYWVIDEAHDAEPEARRAFTATVDCSNLLRLSEKASDSSSSRNVFSKAESRVAGIPAEGLTIFFALTAKCKQAGQTFSQVAQEFANHAKDLLYYDTSKNKSYERIELWLNSDIRKGTIFEGLRMHERLLVDAADKLIVSSQELVAYLEGVEDAAEVQREIATLAIELKELRAAAEIIFETGSEAYAYQATLNRKKEKVEDSFEALPLDIGGMMNETLYVRTHSIVYASATITVNHKFDSFVSAMGLGASEFSSYSTLQLDSSFDFDNNMIIYVVKDMPEPNAPSYLPTLEKLLVKVHRAQHGSMLTLFTNRREMEKCFESVQPELKKDDLRLICQKWGVSVKGLRDDFVADETLSLFALKSFWQGFDAPGATLKGVVIPKLPFARPTDPLFCERAVRDDGAWRHYVLPQAVIETKQAAGRLIRKADDTGVLILADKRLLTKSYGKSFLGSLQSKTIRVCTIDEIARALALMNARG